MVRRSRGSGCYRCANLRADIVGVTFRGLSALRSRMVLCHSLEWSTFAPVLSFQSSMIVATPPARQSLPRCPLQCHGGREHAIERAMTEADSTNCRYPSEASIVGQLRTGRIGEGLVLGTIPETLKSLWIDRFSDEVSITQTRWAYIRRGHRNISGLEQHVVEAIRRPNSIRRDKSRANRNSALLRHR